MRVYDDGRTVVLRFTSGNRAPLVNYVVAFNALTGQKLWQADDFDSRHSMAAPTLLRGPLPFMLVDDGQRRWTRIDTRTGREMWSMELPNDCQYEAAASIDRISYVKACADGSDAVLTLVSVYAATGKIALEKPISRQPLVDNPGTPLDGVWDVQLRIERGSDEALAWHNGAGWHAVDLATGTVTPPVGHPVEFLGDPGPELLTERIYPAHGIEVRAGPDAAVRCEIPDEHWSGRPVAWLGEQVVILTGGDVAGFSRSDCGQGARHSPSADEPIQVIPGPGVLLAIRDLKDRSVVDGYGR